MPTGDRDEFNLKEAFEFARATIQTLVAINGGAAVAVTAFYGQAIGGEGTGFALRPYLADALTDYVIGIVCAGATLAIGYIVQIVWGANLSNARHTAVLEEVARYLQVVGFCLAIASLVFFVCGCLAARGAILA